MAKISLRSYTQEIERMVESGRTEEAIAHCRNILQTYSKCVDVYRLLGKAYLESQRYGDAADIFQRVLSSIPEDFVSHVGMSLIREDEGNLDEAIWHMERAFEIQPSNGAIQDELRRLYGKRDGVEPPKIRLTRGALARMYFKGELYPQAIAELRAALNEDANRLDLHMLLASVHYKAGQSMEAAEKAGDILSKLPNCLEANFLLAQALAGTERDDEVKTYRQNLVSLNPYFAYISEKYPSPELVPDQTVTVEKITWKPGQTPTGTGGQPAWAASLGIDIGGTQKSSESLPDWLAGVQEKERNAPDSRSLPAFSSEGSKEPAPLPDFLSDLSSQQPAPAEKADEIPDWMKSAGWAPSTGEGEKAETGFKLEEPEPARPAGDEPVLQADIPDWLRAMAPADQVEQTGQELAAEGDEDVLPWLDALLPPKPVGSEPIIDSSQAAAPMPDISGDQGSEMPDWLKDSGTAEEGTAAEEEIPDWLSGFDQPSAAEPVSPTEFSPTEPPELAESSDELPDWLLQGESQPTIRTENARLEPTAPAGEIPDWFSETGEETQAAAGPVLEKPVETPQEEEIPDWLLGTTEEQTAEESIPDWMTEETVKAPAPEEPVAEAAQAEEIPDWLLGEMKEEAPAAEEPVAEIVEAAPAEEIPAWLLGEFEEAPAAEEPVAEIVEAAPVEEIPDWLMGEAKEQLPATEEAVAEIPEAAPAEEIPAWLLDEAEEELPFSEELVAEIAEAAPAEEIPDWLLGVMKEEAPAAEEPVSEIVEAAPAEELPDWLLEAAEKAPAAEAPVAEIVEAAPAEEIPDWLMGEIEEAPAAEEPVSEIIEATPAEEIPAWLMSQMEEEAPAIEEAVAEIAEATPAEEIPDWLLETAEKAPAAEEPILEIIEAAPAEEIPDWLLGEMKEETPAAEEPVAEIAETAPAEEIPAWLLGEAEEEIPAAEEPVSEIIEADPAEEIPDWLLGEEEAPTVEEAVAEIAEAAPAEELPDWLLETAEKAPAAEEAVAEIAEVVPAEEIPAWLMDEAEEELPAVEEAIAEIAEAAPAEEIPAWLMGEVEEVPVAEEVVAEVAEAAPVEEIPDWLLGEEEASATEEVIAKIAEAAPAEEIPAWLMGEAEEELPAAEEPVAEIEVAAPAEEIPAWLMGEAEEAPVAEEAAPVQEAPATSSAEKNADAAFAWLESLAVKQGAEEALLLTPEERSETPPDWVIEETAQAEQPETPVEEPVEEILEAAPAEPVPAEEIPAWLLETFGEEAAAAEEPVAKVEEAAPAEKIPDWLFEKPEEEALTEEQEAVPGEALPAEEIPAWLIEPAGTVKSPEEALAQYEFEEEEAEFAPGEAQPAQEIPAWLLGNIETAAEPVAIEQPAAEPQPEMEAPPMAEELPAVQAETAAAEWLDRLEAEAPVDPLADTRPTVRSPQVLEPAEAESVVEILAPGPETIQEEPASAAPSAEMDADAAFAWLESLAVKQGAEEALLLTPEERTEKPPDWVIEETAKAEQFTAPSEPTEMEIAPVETEQPPVEELSLATEPAPAAPSAEMDADAAFAWLESLAVKQGAEEALLLTPEERTEKPPDWVIEEAAKAEQFTEPSETIEMETAPVEAEPPPVEELPAVAEEKPIAAEKAPAAPGVEMDDDAAFAWLESLAVRQGADEALLLKPEDRLENPPDWVYAAEGERKRAAPVVETQPEPVEAVLEAAAAPAVEEPAPVEEPTLAEVPPLAEVLEMEETPPTPGEELPDLPSWLSDSAAEAEELEWTPPPVPAAPLVELNSASLVELERLPGVGFIMAQNILDYRETSGPFHKVEDLLAVPGMSQATLEQIRERIMLIAPAAPPPPPPVDIPILKTVILSTDTEGAPANLSEARETFNQGNIEQALASYNSLIRTNQSLEDVIADLREASYHYADNVQIWQHLGDAYLRANQTKEAMEAYITAEKLLR